MRVMAEAAEMVPESMGPAEGAETAQAPWAATSVQEQTVVEARVDMDLGTLEG